MDFYKIEAIRNGHGRIEIGPSLQVIKSKDLMVRGGEFYAFWDNENNIWSKDMYRLYEVIDSDIRKYLDEHKEFSHEKINFMTTYKSSAAKEFIQYLKLLQDNYHELDSDVTFIDDVPKREDYRSKRLDYSPRKGDISAYEELMSTLYLPDERQKIEWAIGSILCGDGKNIQKFCVFYGNSGTGKSTVMKIISRMFEGYVATFDSKALSNNSSFSLEPFKNNPLVSIQDDGDLSKIEDNTKLNSLTSHEVMTVNAKYERLYSMRFNCFLFMGSNKPVKITDAKSGIIRRLLDIHPTGETIPQMHYEDLMSEILGFEIPAIAYQCMTTYRNMGPRYYTGYRPLDMMYKTDPFFNFVDAYYLTFKNQNSTTLAQSYALYKEWVNDGGADFKMTQYKFREALKDYFDEYYDIAQDASGETIRNLYKDFKVDMFKDRMQIIEKHLPDKIKLTPHTTSILDQELQDVLAQYATKDGKPTLSWDNVFTKLSGIDPTKLHYTKMPENYIVIDFDLKDENGNKSLKLNLEAASKFPATYTEISQSGKGIHLHYIYDGDINQLALIYAEGIEIKVFKGNASLRRKLSKCNDLPIAHIRDGLPLRGEKMLDFKGIENEKHLRAIIAKNLAKQISPNTKPSMDYIRNALDAAYKSGISYDVTDMRQAIVTFAMSSTNQKEVCLKMIPDMKFRSENPSEDVVWEGSITVNNNIEDNIVFFDCEVFPNLFLINWKVIGEGKKIHRMINPMPSEVEGLIKKPLVGYNCRRYDNHILYAAMMGYTNEQLYNLSQRIVKAGKKGPKDVFFAEAYNLSYTDVYDYAAKKQSLKLWEIELGIHHEELGLPWDKPVPEELWEKVARYCDNDVIALEAVWNATKGDWAARKFLATITNSSPNSTTNNLTTKLIFGNDSAADIKPKLVYTDLSKEFPGYKFEHGKSYYHDWEVGEGGVAWSKPGIFYNVKVFDVVSMHPHSALALNMFGPYTERFGELVKARVAAKHNDKEALKTLLGGVLYQYCEDDAMRAAVVQALKIAINSVYGLTCAGFDHKFRDPRNVDNIVAKRGALFIITLKEAVEKEGYNVIHLKTDSIKVENADEYISNFISEFGKKYGYEFEVEDEFERICILNKSNFMAYDARSNEWVSKGNPFNFPYVKKTLFTKEKITFEDICVTNSVQTALYLDFNESLPDATLLQKQLDDIVKVRRVLNGELSAKAISQKKIDLYRNVSDAEVQSLKDDVAKCHDYRFVGRVGQFVPVSPNAGGGDLVRSTDIEGKYDSVQGASGYRWMEAEKVKDTDGEKLIDLTYWNDICTDVVNNINQVGDFEEFTSIVDSSVANAA